MLISSVLSGIFALTGCASSVFAVPVARSDSADVLARGILTPTEDTIWTPGQQVSITWYAPYVYDFNHVADSLYHRDTYVVGSENGTLAVINLYNADDDYPTPVAELAENFQSNTGSYSLTVPSVENGCYIIKS